MKYYACVDWNESTQTCTTHAYVDVPTLLPLMSIQEGQNIGMSLVFLFVSIRVVMMLGKAAKDQV
jgi:hypothetical protein